MKFFTQLFLLLVLPLSALCAEHAVEASVDGHPITATDIKKRTKLVMSSSDIPDTKKSYDMLHDKILDTLIDEQLIAKEMKKHGIEIDDKELQEGLAALAEKNGVTLRQMLDILKSRGMEEAELRTQVHYQLGWSRIITTHVAPSVNVTDREISEGRKGIERAARTASMVAELKLAEIVLFYQRDTDVEKNKAFAQKLVAQVEGGADFKKLARQFSQSQSASSDGEIGWVISNQMPQDLAQRLIRVNEGGITITELNDGIHIFKVLQKKVVSSGEVSISDEEIRNFLLQKKIEVAIKALLKKMRTNAHIQWYSRS